MKRAWAAAVVVLAGAAQAAPPKVRAIQNVRQVEVQVEGLRAKGELKKTSHCSAEGAIIVDLHADAGGLIRFAYEELGGENAIVRLSAYYDEEGRRRYVLADAEAANGTKVERRYYFSTAGKQVDMRHRALKGPGQTWDWALIEKEVINGRFLKPSEVRGKFPPCPALDGAAGEKAP